MCVRMASDRRNVLRTTPSRFLHRRSEGQTHARQPRPDQRQPPQCLEIVRSQDLRRQGEIPPQRLQAWPDRRRRRAPHRGHRRDRAAIRGPRPNDLRPTTEAGRLLVKRYAFLSVRLDRCERHETVMLSKRVREAIDEYDDQRFTDVELLVSQISIDPMTSSRRLQTTPEGIDWLVANWLELRGDLMIEDRVVWTWTHWHKAENLMGNPKDKNRISGSGALTEAVNGFFANLEANRRRRARRPGPSPLGQGRTGRDDRRRDRPAQRGPRVARLRGDRARPPRSARPRALRPLKRDDPGTEI